jgi:GT2 family glycosyltransferase
MKTRVAVIVLNWNRGDLALACIKSVYQSKTKYKLLPILVDNNSHDNSVEIIKKGFPKIHIIQNKQNLGWSGGNNKGIRYALKSKADFIVLLNNDIVVDKHCIQNLVDGINDKTGYDIVGPKIYRFPKKDKIISNAGNFYGAHHYGLLVGSGEKDTGKYDIDKELDFVAGVVCARSEVYKKVGLLNEKFFLYFEDVDFCERAKKVGFRCGYIHTAIQYHWESATNGINSPVVAYYNARNRLLFIKEHFLKQLFSEFLYTIRIIVHDYRYKNSNWYFAFRGLVDFTLGRFNRREYWN